jgi:hypothetical protein
MSLSSISKAVIGLLLITSACHDAGNAVQPEEQTAVAFLFDVATSKASGAGAARRKDRQDATELVVSITDAAGAMVYESEQIELYNFEGSLLSRPLSLVPGSYDLTQFLVRDAGGAVIYAAPLTGSELAYLVADPLAIAVDTTKDTVTTVRPEVLSTAEHIPEDFGYASFGLDVVEVIDFLVAAFVYDAGAQALIPTTAAIEITNEAGDGLYSGSLETLTNKITVPKGHAQYQVTITKPGYADYTQSFAVAELAAYFASDDHGPLEVVLEELFYPASCNAILDAGASTGDGVYTIVPDGAALGEAPFDVYCDMSTAGGGWTLVGALTNKDAEHWSSDAAWSTAVPFGSIANIGNGDHKSPAFGRLQATDLLVSVAPRDATTPFDQGAGVWRHTANAFAGHGNLMNLYNSLSWPTGVCFGDTWSCSAHRAELTASGTQGGISTGGQWGLSMKNFDVDDENGGAVMAAYYMNDYMGSARICNFGGGYKNGTWDGPDVGASSSRATGDFCSHLHGDTAQVLLWER